MLESDPGEQENHWTGVQARGVGTMGKRKLLRFPVEQKHVFWEIALDK
jgi:hypothetical protein